MGGILLATLSFGTGLQVRKEYVGLTAIIGVVGGILISVAVLLALYRLWPCKGDKRARNRESQAADE